MGVCSRIGEIDGDNTSSKEDKINEDMHNKT